MASLYLPRWAKGGNLGHHLTEISFCKASGFSGNGTKFSRLPVRTDEITFVKTFPLGLCQVLKETCLLPWFWAVHMRLWQSLSRYWSKVALRLRTVTGELGAALSELCFLHPCSSPLFPSQVTLHLNKAGVTSDGENITTYRKPNFSKPWFKPWFYHPPHPSAPWSDFEKVTYDSEYQFTQVYSPKWENNLHESLEDVNKTSCG